MMKMNDDQEVRAKAAEISVMYSAHLTAAKITSPEASTIFHPLKHVDLIANYIKTGRISGEW
jgi:hypothetical protein